MAVQQGNAHKKTEKDGDEPCEGEENGQALQINIPLVFPDGQQPAEHKPGISPVHRGNDARVLPVGGDRHDKRRRRCQERKRKRRDGRKGFLRKQNLSQQIYLEEQ